MAVSKHPVHQLLVATDFSESAAGALAVAAQYAHALHARIHLLHVSAVAGADAMRLLTDAAAQSRRDIPIIFAASRGDPAEEILRYAASHSIDLIVLDTHGRTGVTRVLVGSVAERVIRAARCPVLVVPLPRPRVMTEPSKPSGVAAEPTTAERPCLVCATPTRDLICEPCRAHIRGEALERKQREERMGRR